MSAPSSDCTSQAVLGGSALMPPFAAAAAAHVHPPARAAEGEQENAAQEGASGVSSQACKP